MIGVNDNTPCRSVYDLSPKTMILTKKIKYGKIFISRSKLKKLWKISYGCPNEQDYFPFFDTFGLVYRQKGHGQGQC